MEHIKRNGLDVIISHSTVDIIKEKEVVRISKKHIVYLDDITNSFNYYFSAVNSSHVNGNNIVDYSTPRYHSVVGFNDFPIFFPSFAEPLATTRQYLKFANLIEGMTVFDLGAYSGLTSIIFSQLVGEHGRVIAVDADSNNISAIKKNLDNFHKHSKNVISLLEGAVWEHCEGLEFSSEGNMGSSATTILGSSRGSIKKVESYTLSSICEHFQLSSVDFIKCDIEGAEAVIFKDKSFFDLYRPKIIIETHCVDGVQTTDDCVKFLESYHYSCKPITQDGVSLPLIECTPL